MKVVVFNAPPRAGKDFAADSCIAYFKGSFSVGKASFKQKLVELTKLFFKVNSKDWDDRYDKRNPYYIEGDTYSIEWMKDVPWGSLELQGRCLSQREAMIFVSEEVIKPVYGEGAFGTALAESLCKELTFVPDSGFPLELQPVLDKVGADNVLVVRIRRDGCNFDGDSRNWLLPEMFCEKIKFLDIENDMSDNFMDNLLMEVTEWVTQYE